jgi:hypothetical protein
MSPEAILTVDAKASGCVLRSLALLKYTFRCWADLRIQIVRFPTRRERTSRSLRNRTAFAGARSSSVAAYLEVQEPRVVGTLGVSTIGGS